MPVKFHFGDFSLGSFSKQYKCFPVAMMGSKERRDVERGGKSKLRSIFPHSLHQRIVYGVV